MKVGCWRRPLPTTSPPGSNRPLNDLAHPYSPTVYRPIFIPGGTEPPRELPVGFTSLELSLTHASAGLGTGFPRQTNHPTAITAQLDGMAFDSFSNGRHQVGLIGIDDFYENRQPELTIQPANEPLWSQPWQFLDGHWTYNQIT